MNELPTPDFQPLSDSSGFDNFLDNWSTGFGSGLNLTGGVFGLANMFMQDQSIDDQLQADQAQIRLSMQQNKLSWLQKSTNNNMKLAKILSGARASAAGSGVTMNSGSMNDILQRNLSGYDQDNLSNYANYAFTNQKLEEKMLGDENTANDEKDSAFLGALASFF